MAAPQEQQEDLMKTPLFENLRKLVTIIDELRDIGLQQYISLPRIAVVGSQSSGKSSLLENIVGLDFLPRGEGLVTRRPLEMRLVHVPNQQKTWAVFEECKDEKFYSFDKVRDKINELTDKVAKKNKGIVKEQIVLTIYSDDCPDLTLIDLPGITRIPLHGSDQPQDIERVTKEIVYHYIKDERTIILVVIPANADMSTSDGLQMARKVDPEGKRTIGVITKIDIMDKGTDARKMLLNQEIPLKLGYVGVKNRSQMDINGNMRVQKALKAESEFFAKHPVYSTMPQNLLGTRALTSKLSTVMFYHIRAFLPQIVKEIQSKIKDCEEKLKDLGPPMPREYTEKMHLIWNMVTDFTETFKNQIRGKYEAKRSAKYDNSDLSGGAIIKLMFTELYEEFVTKNYKATKDYSDKEIEKAIVLHQGDSIPGFPSIDAFLYLILPLLEQLKEPALDTVTNVFSYLETLSQKLVDKIFARFPSVTDEVQEQASKVLQEERDKARVVVENIIDAELGYLFTNDYNYITQRTSIIPQQQLNEVMDANRVFIRELSLIQRFDIFFIGLRIDAYFDLVVHNIRDTVPKTIGYFLVKAAQEKMQYSLYTEVMKNESILQNLGEPPHIAQERDTISKTLEILRKAQKVLKRDPDLASYQQKHGDVSVEENSAEIKRKMKQGALIAQSNITSQQAPQPTSLFGS